MIAISKMIKVNAVLEHVFRENKEREHVCFVPQMIVHHSEMNQYTENYTTLTKERLKYNGTQRKSYGIETND